MFNAILCRYGELGLKGDNRGYFEKTLLSNIVQVLEPLAGVSVKRLSGRILVTYQQNVESVLERLRLVFGLVSISPAIVVKPDVEEIYQAAEHLFSGFYNAKTFAVRCRRSDKRFPMKSPQLGAWLGSRIIENHPDLKVDLGSPDLAVNVEVRESLALVYAAVYPGPGGLPVSSSGHGVLLLSGGLDSPVAGWMAMKRGIKLTAVYYHSFPFTGDHAKQKVIDLARRLAAYNRGSMQLVIIDVASIQETIIERCPEKLRVTLLRRMMLRLAESLAAQIKAQVLITGDSVGQVASQTLESLNVISEAVDMLLLRPLCAMDKTEIIALARQIATYETSILPYQDCCSLFLPRHPATRPALRETLQAEALVEWRPLLENAFNTREVINLAASLS